MFEPTEMTREEWLKQLHEKESEELVSAMGSRPDPWMWGEEKAELWSARLTALRAARALEIRCAESDKVRAVQLYLQRAADLLETAYAEILAP